MTKHILFNIAEDSSLTSYTFIVPLPLEQATVEAHSADFSRYQHALIAYQPVFQPSVWVLEAV